jgi:hypothetical protein
MLCALVAACGRTTLLPGTLLSDDTPSVGRAGQGMVAGQAGLPFGGTANGAAGAAAGGTASGAGVGGALATSGSGTLPTSGKSSAGDSGRGGSGGTTATAGQPTEAGSTAAGAGGEAGEPSDCQGDACTPLEASIGQGESAACATVNHGPLKCWGDNFNGVLGNTYRPGPTVVPGLETGVHRVSVGTRAACALMDSHEVKCFGLGYGSVTKVTDLPSDVTSVACAAPYFDHTCVASPSTGVICWGANNFGQLGNGMTTPSFTYQSEHTNVIGLPPGAYFVSAGANDTCAITPGGALWCWGMNGSGALGTGVFDQSTTAAPVYGFSSGAAAVAAGEEYTCALTEHGTVKCWGTIANGKSNVAMPVDIAGIDHATAISVGGLAGCAIVRKGALKCWGAGGENQLGTGSTDNSMTQAVDPVGMSSGVVAIGVGEYGACDVMQTGAIYCWGYGPGGGSKLPQPLAGF